MNASIVDLRYKTKQILAALDRRETVSVLYRGKLKARIVPASATAPKRVRETAFFGMHSHEKQTVAKVMDVLRGGRHRDL
ncbi:MAG: type II toxin-antitoxin system Phd/YefM family antitoxin [Deltaproteobacteria bacterium]|nr:type II toxin-antitoxin system Phd/YefM family antitoxin [Deltaproteobacteria bacterium]